MNRLVIFAAVCVLGLFGCNGKGSVRRTPALDAPAVAQQQPAKPGILEQVGDATVRIVQEPGRMISPKKPDPKTPQVYDPPTATIIRRSWVEPAAAETQPDHP